jgi:ppGpp synthetase/RelA/SpoT-type nucleotidyltranferase
MQWTKLKFSKNEVNRAGMILASESADATESGRASDVLSNWRSAHSFPLHIFAVRLKRVATQVDGDALVVRRLKRTPSILKKLRRDQTENMKMSRMQDVAGARAVLKNMKDVKKLVLTYKKSRGIKHKLHSSKDYVSEPKKDGYRSVHLVYKYFSDKNPEYDSLLVEIQIRTKIQHYWATAVETVDHFTRQAIKSNEGEEDWMNFFKLASSVFAIAENTATVPGTPKDEEELHVEVVHLAKKLDVVKKMTEWARIHRIIEDLERDSPKKFDLYLLDLDLKTKELSITGYTASQAELANNEYSRREERMIRNKEDRDIVLVSAETSKELRRAYPNYFLDTKEFITTLRNCLGGKL